MAVTLLRIALVAALAVASLGVLVAGASASSCPNEQFRIEDNSTRLPDCRAYEQVSPADKNGVNVGNPANQPLTFQSRPDGSAIAYDATGAFGDATSARQYVYYRASRTDDGWASTSIDPPKSFTHGIDVAGGQVAISADLSRSLVQSAAVLAAGGVAGNLNLYLRDNDSRGYQFVGTYGGATPIIPTAVGASADFSHVVIQSPSPFTADAAPDGNSVYEWSGGTLHLASLMSTGVTDPGGGWVSNLSLESLNAYLGDSAADEAVSTDGQSIYFNSPDHFTSSPSVEQVYLREGGAQTIRVSASQSSTPDPAGQQPAEFAGATSDGSEAYFISAERLTDTSTAAVDPTNGTGELYRWDRSSERLFDLTTTAQPGGGQVVKVLGVSGDGSYIYFVSTASLATGGTQGAFNIYALHDGAVAFIGADPAQSFVQRKNYSISPSGQYLEYDTTSPLTSYDNTDATGQQRSEVYVYDGSAGALTCASCDPGGAPPTGDATLHDAAPGLVSNYFPRTMLDNGEAFFQTPDGLVRNDTNGQIDVYVDDRGSVFLLSSGTGSSSNLLEDVSETGSDVFFDTRDQLVATDRDQLVDLYDARVGGGFATASATSEGSCSGDDCQGTPTAYGPLGAPAASMTVSGPGNALPSSFAPTPRPLKPTVSVSSPKKVVGFAGELKV